MWLLWHYIFAILCSLLNAPLLIGTGSYVASLETMRFRFTVLSHIIKIFLQNKYRHELNIVCSHAIFDIVKILFVCILELFFSTFLRIHTVKEYLRNKIFTFLSNPLIDLAFTVTIMLYFLKIILIFKKYFKNWFAYLYNFNMILSIKLR